MPPKLPSDDVGFRGTRGPILIAIMVASGVAALDATILATAVPSIVTDLGGFTDFPWLFSIYLLAQAVSVPLYAKLSDVIGRKPILLWGIGLFLGSSILCALAWNMPSLIAFRALQGLGAGAILPLTMTIAGDIYTVEERAKVQGYLASVWAISSVLGPTLGGLFSQFLTWRLIFWINLPLGLAAIVLLAKSFHERVQHRSHRLDYWGAATLTGALSLLILVVLEGGQAWSWTSWQSATCFGVGTLLFGAFLFAESKAAEPILPLWVVTRRLLVTTSLASLGGGAVTLGLTSYLPTYLVKTIGATPLEAGAAVAALTLGWPLAASLSGKLYLRFGFRNAALVGLSLVVAAVVVLLALVATPSLLLVIVVCFVAGVGFGLSTTPLLIAAQASVEWSERGVVTGANQFFRAVGSSVGIAIFGAVANSVWAQVGAIKTDPQTVEAATGAVFWAVLVVALGTFAAAAAIPGKLGVTKAAPEAAAG